MIINPEDYYMTVTEAAEYLNVTTGRIRKLAAAGMITKLKGSVYDRASVEAYKAKRGDKKAGRYPKEAKEA